MVTVVTIALFRAQTGETGGMTTPPDDRAEAIAWLVGRFRFEHLLTDLQQRATANGRPVQLEPADAAPSAAVPKAA
jgi:hypothetical protein